MAILLKCSTRQHTLRLRSDQYWGKTLCPYCGVVDHIRLRRLIRLPFAVFDREVEVVPPIIKQKVIPVLGFLALITGVALMFISRRPPSEVASLMQTNVMTGDSISDIPNTDTAAAVANNNSTSTPDSLQSVPMLWPGLPTNSPASKVVTTPSVAPSPTPTVTTVRYETGTNLDKPQRVGGRAWLRISNGTSSDAIAKLVDNNSGKTVRRVYIQGGDVATLQQVASGFYVLKFSLGSGYDKSSGSFLNSQSFSKFDEIMDFTVQRTGNRIEWFNHEVTLNPVLGGTAQTSSISQDDFEDH